MRQIDIPPPNLWHNRGPYRGLASKDWVPRNAVQRFGAFIIGTVFMVGGLTLIGTSLRFKGEFQALISSAPVAWVVSLFAVALALAVGSFVIWLGGRLLAGCFRGSPVPKGRT